MKKKTINNTIENKIIRYSLLTGLSLILSFALIMYNHYKANEIEKYFPRVSEVSYYTAYDVDGQTILIPIKH